VDTGKRFLKPEVLTRLKGIDLKARLIVEGFLTGLHRSPFRGFSVEFAEHRPYMPGDEIRRIDWKVYGKTDRFYVKEFEEETNLKAYLLLDASGSMSYKSDLPVKGEKGAPRIHKLEYGSLLAASLAFLLLKQQDSVGLAVFDEKIRKYIPPRSRGTHLHTLLRELEVIQGGGETRLSNTFHELAERIKRRGLIIILSDLFDDPDEVMMGLKHFRHKKHEVIVFHILDPAEREFPFEGSSIFRDLETGEELPVDPEELKIVYKKRLADFLDNYKRKCRQNLIDYLPVDTSTPFDLVLTSYLAKRKRLS
jgi:uncharacterized protein (DUF58 family)